MARKSAILRGIYLFKLFLAKFKASLLIQNVIFNSELDLSIRYNDFGEYSYQVTYSQAPLDRILFDNYDDKWKVTSKPHHLHPRVKKLTETSPMNGDPSPDMPILYSYIHP